MKKTKLIKQNSLLHHYTKTKKQSQIHNKTQIHNEIILHILTLVKNYYKEQNDKIRVKTYDRAIYQIRKWNKPITHGSDLLHLEGIGKGMVDKIDTIIRSGTLPILKEKHIDNSIDAHTKSINKKNETEIQSILGFSKPFINEIKRKHNVKTINDFRDYIKNLNYTIMKLTHIQELGLKYYEDLNDLIPRNEITYLGNQLKKIIENKDEGDGEGKNDTKDESNLYKVKVMLSGSYPSQTKKYSKDIDVIIVNTEHNTINHSGTLKKIISHIEKKFEDTEKEKDTEKDTESKNSKNSKKKLEIISLGETKFMGLLYSPLSHKMRHIDIRMVNLEELPYTWLYFSSGQIFNILIRKKLKQKGYKLNEYGLFKNNSKVKFDVYPEHKMEKLKLMFQKKSSQSPQSLEKELLNYIEMIEREIFKIATMEYKNVKERY